MYERFAMLLKERGVTAYRVHKDTGIAQSTFSDWKNGKSVPGAEKLKTIADYFDVSVDYILGRTQHPGVEVIPADPIKAAEYEAERIRMRDENRENMRQTLNAMAQQKSPQPEAEGDIDAMIDSILSELTDSKGDTLMLDGKPASPKAVEYLRESIRANIEHARKLNAEDEKG